MPVGEPRHARFDDRAELSIVRTLIEGDLGGSFIMENDARGAGHGTHARIRLPKAEPEENHTVIQSLEE